MRSRRYRHARVRHWGCSPCLRYGMEALGNIGSLAGARGLRGTGLLTPNLERSVTPGNFPPHPFLSLGIAC